MKSTSPLLLAPLSGDVSAGSITPIRQPGLFPVHHEVCVVIGQVRLPIQQERATVGAVVQRTSGLRHIRSLVTPVVHEVPKVQPVLVFQDHVVQK